MPESSQEPSQESPLGSAPLEESLHRRPRSAICSLRQAPLRVDDAGAMAALLAEAEQVDHSGLHLTAADCARALTVPGMDLPHGTTAYVDDGELVAYQVLHPARCLPDGTRVVRSGGVVSPRYRGRGIGTALVARGLAAAGRADAQLQVTASSTNSGCAAVVTRAGLRAVRWFTDMTRDLTVPVVAAALPSGVELVGLGGPDRRTPYDRARWDEPLRIVHNTVFADHWGSASISAEEWRHRLTASDDFRPGPSVAAVVDGQVVGYVLAMELAGFSAVKGAPELELDIVGTVREWRGRGLAAAMVAQVLAAAAADGYATAALTVDADNPTGALGVYARAGFVPERQTVIYTGTSSTLTER